MGSLTRRARTVFRAALEAEGHLLSRPHEDPADEEAYQNFIDCTLKDWQQAYYGTNFDRLVRVKRKYDPDDFFHFRQSISR